MQQINNHSMAAEADAQVQTKAQANAYNHYASSARRVSQSDKGWEMSAQEALRVNYLTGGRYSNAARSRQEETIA